MLDIQPTKHVRLQKVLKPAEIATKMSNAKKENVAPSSENVFLTALTCATCLQDSVTQAVGMDQVHLKSPNVHVQINVIQMEIILQISGFCQLARSKCIILTQL